MNLQQNLPLIIVAVVIVALIAFLLLRPRQRVQLSDSTPLRPHMHNPKPEAEGRGLDGEAAAATSDILGEIIGAPVHRELANQDGRDELTRLKGVGPKFEQALNRLGFYRYDQLARLTYVDIEKLDPQLGTFAGRLDRDRIVEQADYLARGDSAGFEASFGRL
jgi:predicted flap endonuclease-1-like 5' DNA nuclease